MMFVTADDSASAEKKTRGVTGLVSNGAEERLKGGGHVGGGRESVDEGARWEAADHFHCSLSPTQGTLYR